MGSSAQNSSGVHRCRRQVRFNEVPEKVPKVPEKVWEASVSVQNQVRFNRVPEKVPGEGLGGFGAEPGQVQQGSGEGLGGFGAKPGASSTGFRRRFRRRFQEALVQSQAKGSTGFWRRFQRRSGRFWCRARSGSTGFRRRFRRRSWTLRCRARWSLTKFHRRFRWRSGRLWCRARSRLTGFRRWRARSKFNRVPKKVPEKVPGGFSAEPGQVQQGSRSSSTGFWRRFRKRSARLWCRARSGSTGFGRLGCRARSGSTGFRYDSPECSTTLV